MEPVQDAPDPRMRRGDDVERLARELDELRRARRDRRRVAGPSLRGRDEAERLPLVDAAALRGLSSRATCRQRHLAARHEEQPVPGLAMTEHGPPRLDGGHGHDLDDGGQLLARQVREKGRPPPQVGAQSHRSRRARRSRDAVRRHLVEPLRKRGVVGVDAQDALVDGERLEHPSLILQELSATPQRLDRASPVTSDGERLADPAMPGRGLFRLLHEQPLVSVHRLLEVAAGEGRLGVGIAGLPAEELREHRASATTSPVVGSATARMPVPGRSGARGRLLP